ncbi:tetratricopeptide repeat protein [Pontiellaceae bacterium B12219]|nr:tetratricopeptide repeat protein [Pontiellaceae bacterium B12219]
MNKFLRIIIGLLLCLATAQAQDESFQKAQTAYDEGRYAEAVLLYESLIERGIDNPELHYNLANACFKDSDLPKAVSHYRTAWYDLPRDPDIKANLHFALNAAGAIESTPSFLEHLFYSLSRSEWIIVAVIGYILLTLLFILMLFMKRARRTLLRIGLIPAALLLLAGFGWNQWRQLSIHPEWVVVKTEATALFGPVEGSTAHFKLPLGALVQQRSTDSKGWVEVEYDGKQGWLKTDHISPVSP